MTLVISRPPLLFSDPHSIDEATEAWRGYIARLPSKASSVAELGPRSEAKAVFSTTVLPCHACDHKDAGF